MPEKKPITEDHSKCIPFDEELKRKVRESNLKWKHRRRMAYIALFSILAITILSLFFVSVERLAVLKEVITWFYFVMGSIIGTYAGFASIEEWKKKPFEKQDDK